MTDPGDLDSLYRVRFDSHESARTLRTWHEIVGFLRPWIPPDGAVIDIACDGGFFIRNVTAAERWATDIRDMGPALGPGGPVRPCRWPTWSTWPRPRPFSASFDRSTGSSGRVAG